MKPNKTENAGKAALATVLAAFGVAAKKYGPVVAEKAKEIIPAILKIILKKG